MNDDRKMKTKDNWLQDLEHIWKVEGSDAFEISKVSISFKISHKNYHGNLV